MQIVQCSLSVCTAQNSQGPVGAAPSRPRRRMSGRCMVCWALLAGLCVLPSAAGTCATFAAWVRTDKVVPGPITNCGVGTCNKLHGFFAVHVAPDAKSILVTMQITSESGAGARTVTGAGIFGPALADQVFFCCNCARTVHVFAHSYIRNVK